MDLTAAHRLAFSLMKEHGLFDAGWKFDWDRANRRFGVTIYSTRTIRLSAPLTELGDEAQVRNTILHEIAHVLAGHKAGHGPEWRARARAIGCDAQRAAPGREVTPPKWFLTCKTCGVRDGRMRRSTGNKACFACCTQHNNGRFDARFLMVWEENLTLAKE